MITQHLGEPAIGTVVPELTGVSVRRANSNFDEQVQLSAVCTKTNVNIGIICKKMGKLHHELNLNGDSLSLSNLKNFANKTLDIRKMKYIQNNSLKNYLMELFLQQVVINVLSHK